MEEILSFIKEEIEGKDVELFSIENLQLKLLSEGNQISKPKLKEALL